MLFHDLYTYADHLPAPPPLTCVPAPSPEPHGLGSSFDGIQWSLTELLPPMSPMQPDIALPLRAAQDDLPISLCSIQDPQFLQSCFYGAPCAPVMPNPPSLGSLSTPPSTASGQQCAHTQTTVYPYIHQAEHCALFPSSYCQLRTLASPPPPPPCNQHENVPQTSVKSKNKQDVGSSPITASGSEYSRSKSKRKTDDDSRGVRKKGGRGPEFKHRCNERCKPPHLQV
ncbi:hypothetical protein SeLEV6574_g03437 [Synchytrium endobioticum]|uniref:Uncharacterized protein n=1 Tax=Synchytrium endobioticum TaxID=286115 RepID=A0A507D3N8_9FUNG|nr:hypothetical protein SeLEV6574_g03437 [Synchytrium endobioticum]